MITPPAKRILFLSADRTAGGIQRALRDWSGVIAEHPAYALSLHAPNTPALNALARDLHLPHRILTSLHRVLFRFIPSLASLSQKSDICFVHNGFLVPAARHLAHHTIGVCHNDKPAKFQGADYLICLTPDGLAKAKHAGWPDDKLRCIPHFIDDKPVVTKTPHKNALHIISAGRLVEKKNFALFIKMAALAKTANAHLRFSLAGTGPEANRLSRLNADLGNPVEMLGWSDLTVLAANADIFCSPSRDEPYGLVITEMMQAGLAILASPSFGARLILDQGHVAPLLPFDDADAWAQQIGALDADRDRLRQMQKACSKRLDDPVFKRSRFAYDLGQLIDALS